VLCVADPAELAVHHDGNDCSYLNLFEIEVNDNEGELRQLLDLNIVPRQPEISLSDINVNLRRLR